MVPCVVQDNLWNYMTSNKNHFAPHAKGAYSGEHLSAAAAIKQEQVDRSVVPLDHERQSGDGAWTSHSKSMFRGHQIPAGERARPTARRETLGARRHGKADV